MMNQIMMNQIMMKTAEEQKIARGEFRAEERAGLVMTIAVVVIVMVVMVTAGKENQITTTKAGKENQITTKTAGKENQMTMQKFRAQERAGLLMTMDDEV